jgi:hypothetical protein
MRRSSRPSASNSKMRMSFSSLAGPDEPTLIE